MRAASISRPLTPISPPGSTRADTGAESVPAHTHPAGTEPDHTHGGHAQLDAGLLFAAYMNNPPEQFVKAPHLLAGSGRLNTVVQHTGSAIFAMPPGIAAGRPAWDSGSDAHPDRIRCFAVRGVEQSASGRAGRKGHHGPCGNDSRRCAYPSVGSADHAA
nr:Dyp-type peroxidase domain-containing protein [Nocardia acidivorans]